jgi:hypothetical protein
MDKPQSKNVQQKKEPPVKNNKELFNRDLADEDEIESDGSASAFDATEHITEDNFDNLSEK